MWMNYRDKPWLGSYQLGPYKLDHDLAPFPSVPLFDALDKSAENFPTQTALVYQGRSMKYHQLKRRVDRLAAGLARLGLEKGERVCIFLPNCIEYILIYWAVLKCGGVVVPTSVLRTESGLLHEAGSSGSRMIVCREEHLELAQSVADRCQVEQLIVTSDAGYDVEGITSSRPKAAYELRDLLRDHDPDPPLVEINPTEDLCELAFTGGATGVPKGVMLSHYNRNCVVLQGLPWVMKPMLRGIEGKASVLVTVPLFHAYGGFIHHTAVQLGLRMILLPDPRDTQSMLESILEYRPFLIPGVPTQFMRLADAGLRRVNAMLFSGSAPLPQEVAMAIKQKTGMPISEGYGLTETSTLTHINLTAFSRITGFSSKEVEGIGVPCPETDCCLVDPQTGEDVPVGETGELLVRGPQVMQGYWPEAGSGLTKDGWLHTGDIAVMDEKGYFRIVDRIKDMVNVSGLKVYTTQVDEVLFRHPAVQVAAAFGIPDPDVPGSERVMAVIQLKEGQNQEITQGDIQDFCRLHLPPYAVPRLVEFREHIPLTVTEKVFKRALRDEALANLGINSDTH
jgi:long-chain acyl-CoA synthetase